MIRPLAAVLTLLLVVSGCAREESSPLEIVAITVFAPLPGQPAGVAYLLLRNRTSAPVTLQRVESRDFEGVEMHTTIGESGIAQMLPVDSFTIAEHSEVEFAPRGTHLMLLGPHDNLQTGDTVTLDFFYRVSGQNTENALSIEAPVKAR